MLDYLLKNACVEGELCNLAIKDGVIQKRTHTAQVSNEKATEVWELDGRVVIPALADVHVHLDKTFVPLVNQSGTLREAIDVWVKEKPKLNFDSYEQRALKAIKQALTKGTSFIRTHIDINSKHGFTALEAMLKVREQVKELCYIEIVALGAAGLTKAETQAMKTALELGADLVGGAPALLENPQQSIDVIFDLAELYAKDIDLHIDETEDPNSRTLAYLAKKTIEKGFQGRVTAGHCCSLAFMPLEDAANLIDKVAEAKLNIVSLPSCNLVLMGRNLEPKPRGVTRIKELLAAGVNVAAASDNVADPFNPFGHYDALFTANLAAHTAQMTSLEELKRCLDMVTCNATAIMKQTSKLKPNEAANFVILNAFDYATTVTSLADRYATFYKGQCVVKQTTNYEWKHNGSSFT